MFATCSATKMSMAPTTPDQKILRKNGNFQKKKKKKKKKKKDFYPKMKLLFFFQNTGKILCLMKTILYHTQSCKLNLYSSKRHTDMARKETNPLRG